MPNPAQILTNPIVVAVLRTAMGSYIVYMARRFYADPTSYFRKTLHALPDAPWFGALIRAMAAFCLWGGCFIIAAAIAVQVLGLHGELLAIALVALAAACAWLLLPRRQNASPEDNAG